MNKFTLYAYNAKTQEPLFSKDYETVAFDTFNVDYVEATGNKDLVDDTKVTYGWKRIH